MAAIATTSKYKQKIQKKIFRKNEKKLPDWGSNLDSSGPKPDVLPVTPSGKKLDNKNKNLKQRYKKIRANVLNQIIDP